MNFTKILKKSTVLVLFALFIALSIVALNNLLARKIGNSVTFETRKTISLPSWTLCPFGQLTPWYNESNVQELDDYLERLPIRLRVMIEDENTGDFLTLHMTDTNILKQHFNATMEETWNVHCKVNYFGTGCDPCITFNAPQKGVGKFYAFLKITQENPNTMTLLFHDPDSSLALSGEYNWNQVLYFVIKQGKT